LFRHRAGLTMLHVDRIETPVRQPGDKYNHGQIEQQGRDRVWCGTEYRRHHRPFPGTRRRQGLRHRREGGSRRCDGGLHPRARLGGDEPRGRCPQRRRRPAHRRRDRRAVWPPRHRGEHGGAGALGRRAGHEARRLERLGRQLCHRRPADHPARGPRHARLRGAGQHHPPAVDRRPFRRGRRRGLLRGQGGPAELRPLRGDGPGPPRHPRQHGDPVLDGAPAVDHDARRDVRSGLAPAGAARLLLAPGLPRPAAAAPLPARGRPGVGHGLPGLGRIVLHDRGRPAGRCRPAPQVPDLDSRPARPARYQRLCARHAGDALRRAAGIAYRPARRPDRTFRNRPRRH